MLATIYAVVSVIVLEDYFVCFEQLVHLLFGERFELFPVAVLHASDGEFAHLLRERPSVLFEICPNVVRHPVVCIQSFSVHTSEV